MKIWVVAFDYDGGLETEVYTAKDKADAAAREWLADVWDDHAEEWQAMPDGEWQDIYKALGTMRTFIDTVTVDEHEIEVPA